MLLRGNQVPEPEWRSGNDIYKMLEYVRGKVSDRKLRLFAVACCHRPYYCIEDERHQRAVELAERMADEDVSEVEWQHINQAAYELWQSTWAASITAQRKAPRGTHEVKKLMDADMATAAGWAVLDDAWEAAYQVTGVEWDEMYADEPDYQLAFLHDIFGKPFNRVITSWFTPTIFTLAQAIYADRAFANLPILADALEEAGCDDIDILAHCRSGGEHVRGCWVIDLILGKV